MLMRVYSRERVDGGGRNWLVDHPRQGREEGHDSSRFQKGEYPVCKQRSQPQHPQYCAQVPRNHGRTVTDLCQAAASCGHRPGRANMHADPIIGTIGEPAPVVRKVHGPPDATGSAQRAYTWSEGACDAWRGDALRGPYRRIGCGSELCLSGKNRSFIQTLETDANGILECD